MAVSKDASTRSTASSNAAIPACAARPSPRPAAFRIEGVDPFEADIDAARQAKRNATVAPRVPDYPVVRPFWQTDQLNTPREKVATDYDIIVAGAGTGGWAAAVQAARMGTRVLLLEETDWIGGQTSLRRA